MSFVQFCKLSYSVAAMEINTIVQLSRIWICQSSAQFIQKHSLGFRNRILITFLITSICQNVGTGEMRGIWMKVSIFLLQIHCFHHVVVNPINFIITVITAIVIFFKIFLTVYIMLMNVFLLKFVYKINKVIVVPMTIDNLLYNWYNG